MAEQVWNLSLGISGVSTGGLSALRGAISFDVIDFIWSWLGVFLLSFGSVLGYPFLLFDVWLLSRLRSGEDPLSTLFLLAMSQPIHSFMILVRGTGATSGEIILGASVLVGSLIGLGYLLQWWRRVLEERHREEEESELEL